MFQYHCLNPIAGVGLANFNENYQQSESLEGADAVLVRSAAMHGMELPKSILAVARAGAGVNNIPIDRCSEEGIVVRAGYRCIQHTGSQCKWRQRAGACRHAACIPRYRRRY